MENNEQRSPAGIKLVIPFLLTLAILTAVSFAIPLRPAQSQMERRNLAELPEFSWEALADGSYFDGITLWFSDTFPGRESWISLSKELEQLHGHSDIAIAGELPIVETLPPEPTVRLNVPEETEPDPTDVTDAPTEATEAGWQGVEVVDEDLQIGEAVIQIGDSAFNPVGFSVYNSDRYAKALTKLADTLADQGVRVISAPAPTAVGILISPENQARLRCSDQNETIRYFHDQMSDNVIKVDTYAALLPHNDEYIYFRTDHHWTALGAYYAYVGICEALDKEPVPIEELEVWDQGEMEGSLYWKAPNRRKLKLDTLIAYIPKGDMELRVRTLHNEGTVRPLIQDMTKRNPNVKYNAFLFSDNAMVSVTNGDITDGSSCLVVKDSFGNPLVPFIAQNYSTVYAIDYRKFQSTSIQGFLKVHPVDDVIFAPYVIATQATDGAGMFERLCR